MNVFLPNRRLTLAEQYHGLRARFPNSHCYLTGNNKKLVWEGKLSPGPYSRSYLVRIEYAPPETPDCYVISPNLKELAKSKRIPHTYATDSESNKTQLCLFCQNRGIQKSMLNGVLSSSYPTPSSRGHHYGCFILNSGYFPENGKVAGRIRMKMMQVSTMKINLLYTCIIQSPIIGG